MVPSDLLAWPSEITPETSEQQTKNVVVATNFRESCSSQYIVLITKRCLNQLMTVIGSANRLKKDYQD